jgi:hypothetical protein
LRIGNEFPKARQSAQPVRSEEVGQ